MFFVLFAVAGWILAATTTHFSSVSIKLMQLQNLVGWVSSEPVLVSPLTCKANLFTAHKAAVPLGFGGFWGSDVFTASSWRLANRTGGQQTHDWRHTEETFSESSHITCGCSSFSIYTSINEIVLVCGTHLDLWRLLCSLMLVSPQTTGSSQSSASLQTWQVRSHWAEKMNEWDEKNEKWGFLTKD